jgi:hypothetical protein
MANAGYRLHRRVGHTPAVSYAAMRRLFAVSPEAFDRLAERARLEADVTREEISDSAPPAGLANESVADAVTALDRDGYFVLPATLPAPLCAALVERARSMSAEVVRPTGEVSRARFDPDQPLGPRYDFAERDVVGVGVVQDLLGDRSLLDVARAYLRCEPVQDLVAMWWSVPFGTSPSGDAAQLFHFDLDRLNFLKLFVYLTDVTDLTGPHMYVPGTHRTLPASLRAARRYEDDEVAGEAAVAPIAITGRAGTMFFADTRGLHKGLPPAAGARLVLQFQWSTSLFGAPYHRLTVTNSTPAFHDAVRTSACVYRRFDVGANDGTHHSATTRG